jgi:hypothetical protein
MSLSINPDFRVSLALRRAGIGDAGPGLRALTGAVLAYVDRFPAGPADELAGYIADRLPAFAQPGEAFQLVAEAPELYEGTCPAAERALEDAWAEADFPEDITPRATSWRILYSLVDWIVRDELEYRGNAAIVAAAA